MKPLGDISLRYASALQRHVRAPDEGTLTLAYEIGRTALSHGLGVLDMALLHHEALGRVVPAQLDQAGTPLVHAAEFFAESLSAFEMSLRGYRDANERLMALNETLQRAKATAELANRELESFSYSVAHDLRAPLRGIDGFSQALLEDYADKLDADGKRYLGFLRESAQRMAQLIDDLLKLSRVTRSGLQRERVDLSEIARSVVEQLRRAEPERQADVAVAGGLVAEADARLVRIVLENLLGNAWKFTRGRPEPRIEFGALAQGGQRVYFVRDNGAGFDMTYANKLFGVFQRLHSAKEFEGTGIGLATVLRIISRHDGRVWAEGEVDRGATFYFTLGGEPEPAPREGKP